MSRLGLRRTLCSSCWTWSGNPGLACQISCRAEPWSRQTAVVCLPDRPTQTQQLLTGKSPPCCHGWSSPTIWHAFMTARCMFQLAASSADFPQAVNGFWLLWGTS